MINNSLNNSVNNLKEKYKLYQNYIIIAILSIISVFFLPMLGSEVGLGFKLPDTVAGWLVYIATKTCIVIINIMIFDQFVKQGKVNAKDNPKYIEAESILLLEKDDDEDILPAEYYIKKMYRSKVKTTAIFTILGVFGFTNAILTFDWVSMLSYLFTISIGLVFGWMSMNQAEEIWVEKHYRYAKYIEKERERKEESEGEVEECMEMVEEELPEQIDDNTVPTGGEPVLESPSSDSLPSDIS